MGPPGQLDGSNYFVLGCVNDLEGILRFDRGKQPLAICLNGSAVHTGANFDRTGDPQGWQVDDSDVVRCAVGHVKLGALGSEKTGKTEQ